MVGVNRASRRVKEKSDRPIIVAGPVKVGTAGTVGKS